MGNDKLLATYFFNTSELDVIPTTFYASPSFIHYFITVTGQFLHISISPSFFDNTQNILQNIVFQVCMICL